MANFAIVATIKTVPGKRDDFLSPKGSRPALLDDRARHLEVRNPRAAEGSRHDHAVRGLCQPGSLRSALDGPVHATGLSRTRPAYKLASAACAAISSS